MRLLNKQVLVKSLPPETLTKGGIIVVEKVVKHKPIRAEVILSEEGSKLAVGENILYRYGRNLPITVEGRTLDLVSEDDILIVFNAE